MSRITIIFIMLLTLTLATSASAQPVVAGDNRVTFRLTAPNASSVMLMLEGADAAPMTKGADGVWTATAGPLAQDYYTYYFMVDGIPSGDPANPVTKPAITGGAEAILHVPGPQTPAWEPRESVARGTIETINYDSKVIGEPRELVVYLPPGYKAGSETKYPVLYLLHGVLAEQHAWTTAGRANVILDNLLAEGRVQPMIVVMPQGYGFKNAPQRALQLLAPMDHKSWMQTFGRSMMSEIIPTVETRYAVRTDRESRAIAGLSMGGAQSLYIGMTRPDVFGSVVCMSSAFMMYDGKFDDWLGKAKGKPAAELPKLWITTGNADFVLPANKQVDAWLTANNIPHEYTETPGSHTWAVWRRALMNHAPNLFN